jgi:hypothetical protein
MIPPLMVDALVLDRQKQLLTDVSQARLRSAARQARTARWARIAGIWGRGLPTRSRTRTATPLPNPAIDTAIDTAIV